MGDTGIAVNPEDRRYQHLIGKTAIIPFVNRRVPIIADEYVTMDFGTGCLKVTPAHDTNDYEIGLRHGLEIIDTIGLDGKLTSACEVEKYTGMDRFEVSFIAHKVEGFEDFQQRFSLVMTTRIWKQFLLFLVCLL